MKTIAKLFLLLGVSVFVVFFYRHLIDNIPTGDLIIFILMGFTFSFFGLLQVHSKDIDQKKRIRRYFIIALVIFLALTIVSFFLESFFHWFYVITILFFSFTVTPLNANLRILHWSNYVNSKFILSILGYADHIGAIILTIGIVFKTLQWPFANLLIGIGVALLSIAAVVWNIQFRKSIDYKILIENELK